MKKPQVKTKQKHAFICSKK